MNVISKSIKVFFTFLKKLVSLYSFIKQPPFKNLYHNFI
uniref:Uncharacterized protein n=1 Tax=Caudovirales sp. ctIbU14 TaxID=2825761 RepID=A0A8S5NTH0_9CAUD|nr:MAG TPA: hypothetical protein [Caudovirales sp. ctIbU14]